MATQDLAGSVATGSAATALLDISTLTTNEPPSADASSNIVAYNDPSASTVGTVTAGVVDGLPNTANAQLTPFLRTSFTTIFNSDFSPVIWLTIPSGLVKGDLMVLSLISATTTVPTIPALLVSGQAGWTLQKSRVDSINAFTVSIWTRVVTGTDAGLKWTLGSDKHIFGQIRVYGNATFSKAVITENAMGSSGQSTTAALSDAAPYGLVAYYWPGYYNTFPNWTASIPSPLGNAYLSNSPNYVGMVSADLATVAASQPGRTAVMVSNTSPAFTTSQLVMQVAVILKPMAVFRYSEVSLTEATGASQDTVVLESYVQILGSDAHSPQEAYGFTEAGMNDPGTGTVYSYERWVRVRFDPNFNTVRAFRFWAPNLTGIPAGWAVKYGTTTSYSTPVNTASSIATSPVPTSDPGQASPNAGGATRLAGTGTQYSDWIVLQASADTAVVGPGPVLGFSIEGTLIPIEFCFNWTET